MTEALETVAGRRGWIISDGKTGNDVQTHGVFDALRLEYAVKRVAPSGTGSEHGTKVIFVKQLRVKFEKLVNARFVA